MSSQQFQSGVTNILILGGQTALAYSTYNFTVAFDYIPTMSTAQVDSLEMNTTATTLPTSGGKWDITVLFTDPAIFNAFVAWKDQTLTELSRVKEVNSTSSKKLSGLTTSAVITLYQNNGTVQAPELSIAMKYMLSDVQISAVSPIALTWTTPVTMAYTVTFNITGVTPIA